MKNKITDRVNNFEDILKEADITKTEFEISCSGLSEDEVAYRQIKLIAKVYNEGWKSDWNNSDEYKYYPYFDMRNKSGFGFSHTRCVYWHSFTFVGSRLCFRTKKLAEDAGRKFTDIYKKFLN